MDASQSLDFSFAEGMQAGLVAPSVVPEDSVGWSMSDNHPFESWDGNLLDAFEQYLDSTPNLNHEGVDHRSFGVQQTDGVAQLPTTRQSSGDIHSHPELSKTLSSNERKQQNNRAAQKRFRAKQKVRSLPHLLSHCATSNETCGTPRTQSKRRMQAKSQTIEAQLAETTAQLNELKVKQKQLEARNMLLEKVAALNRQPSTGSTSPKVADVRPTWQACMLASSTMNGFH